MVDELGRALDEAELALTGGAGGLVVMSLGQVGKPASRPNSFFLGTGDHVGAMRVELQPSDRRTIRTQALVEEWRSRIRPLPGLETMTILERQAGPARSRDRHSHRGRRRAERSRRRQARCARCWAASPV